MTTPSVRFPRLGLGTAPLANLYSNVPESQAVETIQTALVSGINFFDTAPLYGATLAEKRLGLALRGVPRDTYILESKVGRIVDGQTGEWHFDFSRDGILRSLESSLERLGVDHLDSVLVHDPDDHIQAALDAAFPTLEELRSQGVIQAYGAGMNQWEALEVFALETNADVFMLAGRYTLLEQGASGFMNLCQQKGIAVLAAGVYNSGILATGAVAGAKYQYADAPEEILERVRRLETVCHRHDVPLRVAALQFPTLHPATASLVVGASSPQTLRENLEALHTPVPNQLWHDLQSAGLLSPQVSLPIAQERV